MQRRKVLGIGAASATMLVEDNLSKQLRVLKRINVSGWDTIEVQHAADVLNRMSNLRAQEGEDSALGATSGHLDLGSAYLVKVLSVTTQNAFINVVTEYFEQGSFTQFLAKQERPFSEEFCLSFFEDLLNAVTDLHLMGVVHCRLLSDRVFVRESSQLGIPPKLVVGLACNSLRSFYTNYESSKWKSDYPPEVAQVVHQLGGGTEITTTSASRLLDPDHGALPQPSWDLWQLGALLNRILAHGRGQRLSGGPHGIRSRLSELGSALTSDSPALRPTAEACCDIVRSLRSAMHADPTASPSPSPMRHSQLLQSPMFPQQQRATSERSRARVASLQPRRSDERDQESPVRQTLQSPLRPEDTTSLKGSPSRDEIDLRLEATTTPTRGTEKERFQEGRLGRNSPNMDRNPPVLPPAFSSSPLSSASPLEATGTPGGPSSESNPTSATTTVWKDRMMAQFEELENFHAKSGAGAVNDQEGRSGSVGTSARAAKRRAVHRSRSLVDMRQDQRSSPTDDYDDQQQADDQQHTLLAAQSLTPTRLGGKATQRSRTMSEAEVKTPTLDRNLSDRSPPRLYGEVGSDQPAKLKAAAQARPITQTEFRTLGRHDRMKALEANDRYKEQKMEEFARKKQERAEEKRVEEQALRARQRLHKQQMTKIKNSTNSYTSLRRDIQKFGRAAKVKDSAEVSETDEGVHIFVKEPPAPRSRGETKVSTRATSSPAKAYTRGLTQERATASIGKDVSAVRSPEESPKSNGGEDIDSPNSKAVMKESNPPERLAPNRRLDDFEKKESADSFVREEILQSEVSPPAPMAGLPFRQRTNDVALAKAEERRAALAATLTSKPSMTEDEAISNDFEESPTRADRQNTFPEGVDDTLVSPHGLERPNTSIPLPTPTSSSSTGTTMKKTLKSTGHRSPAISRQRRDKAQDLSVVAVVEWQIDSLVGGLHRLLDPDAVEEVLELCLKFAKDSTVSRTLPACNSEFSQRISEIVAVSSSRSASGDSPSPSSDLAQSVLPLVFQIVALQSVEVLAGELGEKANAAFV